MWFSFWHNFFPMLLLLQMTEISLCRASLLFLGKRLRFENSFKMFEHTTVVLQFHGSVETFPPLGWQNTNHFFPETFDFLDFLIGTNYIGVRWWNARDLNLELHHFDPIFWGSAKHVIFIRYHLTVSVYQVFKKVDQIKLRCKETSNQLSHLCFREF